MIDRPTCCACSKLADGQQVDNNIGRKIWLCLQHLEEYAGDGAEGFCANHPTCAN